MKSSIFIPQKIKVGFQERSDTYTGKLGYIIYYDNKGVLRKEKSWNSWRDKNIETMEFENVLTSGFVLNKKVGGYSTGWNHRQTYCRVYDERNFEFEITIPNLLYILENTSSIKGKGLEGDFVYGWDGKDLILIPTDSPDYKELSELNNLRHAKKKFDGKNLILGGTYKSNSNDELIYLGRFYERNKDNKETKSYFFYDKKSKWNKITIIKTLTGNIIDVIDEICVEDYADLMDELLKSDEYSTREPKYDEYKDYTLEEFKENLKGKWYYGAKYYVEVDNKIVRYYIERYRGYNYYSRREDRYNIYTTNKGHKDEIIIREASIEQVYNKIQPKYLITYDSNKKLIKEWN